ncbi:MAG: branched-chain amino acid ABC transporter permease [Thermoproteota archaeon]|jgi:branched-chain amino acid transport system permease protein|nr:branched-chain amino acid ABC transporter permease [Thermoproteota archaeon]
MIIFLSIFSESFYSILFWGLIIGIIYSLLALGLNIIFGVMKVVNFAHGEIMITGAYITYFISTMFNIDPFFSIPISMVIVGLLGMSIERAFFRPIKGTSKLNEIFVSIALILIIQNSLAQTVLEVNKEVKPVLMTTAFSSYSIELGSLLLPLNYLIILMVTSIFLFLFYIIIMKTSFGRRLRATSQNRNAANLMGINVERIDMISFGIGASLAAMAGSFFGIISSFDVYSGTLPAIKAFAIIILGGLGSIPGAIAGGLILGMAENIALATLGGSWGDAIAFLILTIVLILRPSGIFGRE